MSIAGGKTVVDKDRREIKEHGTYAFPAAIYLDDLRGGVPWHWHEEFEVGVMVRGEILFTAGSEEYRVRAGEGFCLNSGVLHTARNSAPQQTCELHSIVFHPELVGGNAGSIFWSRYLKPLMTRSTFGFCHLHPHIEGEKRGIQRIAHAWQLIAWEPRGYEFRVRQDLSELILFLCENIPEQTGEIRTAAEQRDEIRIKEMLSYIHKNYPIILSVREIAESASISESEALRCFRRMIGMSPIRYVRQYRVERAMEMLSDTEEKIGTISAACGFQDTSYFGKTFREVSGMTPSEYRRKAESRQLSDQSKKEDEP